MGHWLEDSVTASRSASPGSGDKNDLLLEDGSVYSVQGTSSISWTGSGMLLGLIGWHSWSDPPHRVPPIISKLSCTLAKWLSMMTLSLGLRSCPWGFCLLCSQISPLLLINRLHSSFNSHIPHSQEWCILCVYKPFSLFSQCQVVIVCTHFYLCDLFTPHLIFSAISPKFSNTCPCCS